MSTKVTIAYNMNGEEGDQTDFHLFYDYADDKIHLEVNSEEVELRSWKDGYEVTIPVDVMENIIKQTGTNRFYPWREKDDGLH